MIDDIRQMIDLAKQQAGNIVRKGIIKLASSSAFLQVRGFGDESFEAIELWQHYGLVSRPPAGTQAVLVSPNGADESAIAVATDNRTARPTDLSAGEVKLYGPKSGADQTSVHCKAVDLDLNQAAAGTVNVGGDDEFLLMGEKVKTDLTTFATSVSTATTTVQIATAAGILLTAISSGWLSTKAKVGG